MKSLLYILFSLALFFFFFLSIKLYALDSKNYEVIVSDNSIELRKYNNMLIAEVEIRSKNQRKAGNKGFKILADYIFGNNRLRTNSNKSESQKIDMTSPVLLTKQINNNFWKMAFIIPSDYTLKTVPVPNNSDIVLYEKKLTKVASISFSGFNSHKNFYKYKTQLQNYMNKNKLEISGLPIYAYYNPPFVPYFLRKYEILIPYNN